ncbi:AraC family transcriptional regulator [Lacrimispora sp.]|uniref:AraC family transcriptional regulator n=1 Tax=Lacrimispora sp. TaxID=2719234 RepID=UPI00285A593A|nr:AraC family transcriptional regulator [Lacrimispora sp.]MDR7811156.1 AraC family transcriptional regulator [Lacrimispora sp.]
MNYREHIEKSIEFMEDHIRENITIEEIANQSGYSLYHFCRVFNLCMGVSAMEYIRERRLSLASTELFKGRKVIDIAVDYGFETSGGFTKAFRKTYGYTPTQYVERMSGYADVKNACPVIVKRPAFKVAGYGIKTDITGAAYTKDIASFWSNYNGENLESKMYKILNPAKHGEVGLYIPLSEDGNAIYLLGVIVDDFTNVREDMLTAEIPDSEYAVFTTNPVDTTNDREQKEFAKVIAGTWKYIFEDWFRDSGYVYDESKFDFEFYDERCHHRQDTVMDIYIPVKKA